MQSTRHALVRWASSFKLSFVAAISYCVLGSSSCKNIYSPKMVKLSTVFLGNVSDDFFLVNTFYAYDEAN